MTSTNEQHSTRFADLDGWRMHSLLEDEHTGDRTLSQYNRNLRNLTTPMTSNDFIFTLWVNRLPVHVQRVLAAKEEKKAETLTRIADRPETEQIAAVCADSTATEERQNRAMNPINDSLCRLEAQINALSLDTRRRLRSNSKYRRSRSGRRSQNSDLCWYHKTFRSGAKKCRTQCNWVQGNGTSRQ